MPRGPKPTPVAKQVRRGNPGKRKLPAEIVTATTMAAGSLPQAPDLLDEDGRRAWELVGRQIAEVGMLSEAHLPTLEGFSQAYQLQRRAFAALQSSGWVKKGSKGGAVIAPEFRVWETAFTKCLAAGELLGASPVSMARLGLATLKGRTLQERLAEQMSEDGPSAA